MAGDGEAEGETERGLTRRVRRFRERWEILSLLPAAGPTALTAYGITWAISIVVPLGLPLASGALVGALVRAAGKGSSAPEARGVVVAMGAMAAVFIGQRLFEPVSAVARQVAIRRIDAAAEARLMRASMAPVGVAHLDQPEVLNDMNQARAPLGAVVISVPQLAGRYLTAAAACVIVARASWWLAVVVFAIVLYQRQFWRAWGLRMHVVQSEVQAPIRRSNYFSDLLLTPAAAKEVRVFGLARWVMGRQAASAKEMMDRLFPWYDGMLKQFAWALPVRFAGFAIPYVVLAHAAATRQLGLATFAAALQATGTAIGQAAFTGEDVALEHLLIGYPALRRVEHVAEQSAADTGTSPPAAPAVAADIEIRDLTFAYPNTGRRVYDGFDLTIRAGESLAIVGANGAGKTTLVKLLARLYEPDDGSVAVGGTDLRALDPAAWRKQLAVIFQDFTAYGLSVADNVGFGAPEHLGDRSRLERAATRAGALDVRAEADLFDRFLSITQGLTTILISHRFSTVRRADRICVVEHGKVVEDGSHQELVAAGGRYAEMFRLQASRFSDDVVSEEVTPA